MSVTSQQTAHNTNNGNDELKLYNFFRLRLSIEIQGETQHLVRQSLQKKQLKEASITATYKCHATNVGIPECSLCDRDPLNHVQFHSCESHTFSRRPRCYAPSRCLRTASSLIESAANLRMPSESFSVAIWSSLSIQRNDLSSKVTGSRSSFLATLSERFR